MGENQIKLDSNSPKYAQVREILRARMEDGEYLPGMAIPSESDLADEFGIHRLTVRNAIDSLVKEGLLKPIQGKGVYVLGKKIKHNLESLAGFRQKIREQGLKPSVKNLIKTVRTAGLKYAKLLEIREFRRKTMKTIEVLIQEGDFGDSEIRALYLIVNESYVEQDAIDELIDRYIKEKWEYQMTTHGLRNQIFECETKLIFFEDKMPRYRYEIEIRKRDFSKPDSLLLKLEEVKNGVNEVQSKISQVLSEIQELRYEPL